MNRLISNCRIEDCKLLPLAKICKIKDCKFGQNYFYYIYIIHCTINMVNIIDIFNTESVYNLQ